MFKKISVLFILTLLLFSNSSVQAQVNPDETGAWYMYFFNVPFEKNNFGVQGDLQLRNFDVLSDLDQLLLRGSIFYDINPNIRVATGYAYISSGTFGPSRQTFPEHRIYQEVTMPHKIGTRFFLTHRFRYEQRFIQDQEFRTRFRYNLFLNIPLNQESLSKNAIYLALYNEIFLNGERKVIRGNSLEIFDRNRFYTALGYSITDDLRVQAGYMEQTTDFFSKGQIQLSLHHVF